MLAVARNTPKTDGAAVLHSGTLTIPNGDAKIYYRPGSIIVSPKYGPSKCVTYSADGISFEDTQNVPAVGPVSFKGNIHLGTNHQKIEDGDFVIDSYPGRIRIFWCKGNGSESTVTYTDRHVRFTTKFW